MIVCAPADPACAAAQPLIAALDAALLAICGDSGSSSFDPDDVRGPGAVFLLAHDAAGAAVGCGALRPHMPAVAELKRMYARPGSRAGSALLAALEAQALAFGYHEIRLSTRRVNDKARAFYERHGYAEIAPYGRYVGRERSVCMGKRLG